MVTIPTFFEDFLGEIRPTPGQRTDYRDGHRLLRQRLKQDADLSPLIVTTFLQGSIRRATATRPKKDDRPDVDVVVVTDISRDEPPADAMDRFRPFLDRHYAGKWSPNDRSFRIELSKVKLDLVITSKADAAARAWTLLDIFETEDILDAVDRWDAAFSTSEPGWKDHPIWIPDRRLECWQPTHPLAQIQWTWEMNRDCNGHYVNVVKVVKWLNALHPTPEYPKSYPLEHLIGTCCPRGISSVAEGVTRTLEAIRDRYGMHAQQCVVPQLKDHGVDQDVMHRLTGEDFAAFHALASGWAEFARSALDETSKRRASEKWRDLLGSKFPLAIPDDDGDVPGGFSKRTGPTVIGGARYG